MHEPRIHVYPADDGGCGHYRLRWPAAAAHAAGADVHDCYQQALGDLTVTRQGDQLNTRLTGIPDADVVIMQRVTRADHVAAIPLLQAAGIAVVVDADDHLGALPRGHPYRTTSDPARHPRNNRRWLNEACRLADWVTVSTPRLADVYGRHGRVTILPNCIPNRYLQVTAPPHDGLRVGWTGSTVTHVNDLTVCGTAVRDVLDTTGTRFVAVGTGAGVADQLHLDPTQVDPTGWVDLDTYPTVYASLDVAIVPLQPNDFNEAKSWLKGLEAAAVGVPFVASPTGPYRDLADMGAGLLAANPTEWRARLELLTTSMDARAEVAERGRQVAAQWTIESRVDRWIDAWHQAHQHRRTHRELRIA